MSRMVPAMALITSLPEMTDRGAFMSINSSLQYVSGGIAAALGGIIIRQSSVSSPIENFEILGVLMAIIVTICGWLVFRVNRIVQSRKS